MAFEGKWWHTEEGKVVCDLCPRQCRLPEGKRGFCFVRENAGGRMVLSTYGLSTGFCIDPIEKKPLNHFFPGTPILSFGTAGCNLGCKFCQNWDISKSREIERLSEKAQPEDIARAAKRTACRSIAFTYNDPVIWSEYAIDTALAARELGVKTVAVTAGYITAQARPDFYGAMDAANVDLKGFSEGFYRKLALGSLSPVLETLEYIAKATNVWLEVTTLLIPGENDSVQEIEAMCAWLAEHLGCDVPLHLTAFHPDYRVIDRAGTPHSTLIRAREQALAAGLRYVYTGNVLDRERQSTYCPSCQAMVIERNHYVLGRYDIAGGACRRCAAPIAGRFDEQPGTWGSRRQAVRI